MCPLVLEKCTNCSGGKVRCTNCYGSGRVSCTTCGGSGKRWLNTPVWGNGHYETCTSCGGSGKKSCTCGGGYRTCQACGGRGGRSRYVAEERKRGEAAGWTKENDRRKEKAEEEPQRHFTVEARSNEERVATTRTNSFWDRSLPRGPFHPVWWSEVSILGDMGRIGDGLFHAPRPLRLISALVIAIAFWIASLTWPWAVIHVHMWLPDHYTLGWVFGSGAFVGLFVPSVVGWFILLIRGIAALAATALIWLAVLAVVFYGIKWLAVSHASSPSTNTQKNVTYHSPPTAPPQR